MPISKRLDSDMLLGNWKAESKDVLLSTFGPLLITTTIPFTAPSTCTLHSIIFHLHFLVLSIYSSMFYAISPVVSHIPKENLTLQLEFFWLFMYT